MWKKEDFEGKLTSLYTSNIMQTLANDGGGLHLSGWLRNLYEEYCFGSWNRKIPDPASLDDQKMLGSHMGETHCMFHKQHPKFGQFILETGDNYNINHFCFFDYSILEVLFEALDNYPNVNLPYIPTYYASPEDRYDYEWFANKGLV